MNKWNKLLAVLDQVYGFENQVKSSMKKIKQGFDEKANEHVVVIEYRVMRGDNARVARKNRHEERKLQRAKKAAVGNLLRDLYTQAMTGDAPAQVDTSYTDSPNPDYPV